MKLTKKEQARRTEIIRQLMDMSKRGWRHAIPNDYQPLERELAALDEKWAARR